MQRPRDSLPCKPGPAGAKSPGDGVRLPGLETRDKPPPPRNLKGRTPKRACLGLLAQMEGREQTSEGSLEGFSQQIHKLFQPSPPQKKHKITLQTRAGDGTLHCPYSTQLSPPLNTPPTSNTSFL